MKKSTIFIVAIVYVVSFIIVGFFGIKAKAFNPVSYVSDIEIKAIGENPNLEYRGTKESTDSQTGEKKPYESYKITYSEETIVRFSIRVLPDNTTYPDVTYDFPASDYVAYAVEEGNVVLTFKKLTEKKTHAANFSVISTDGKYFTKTVKILSSFTK